MTNDEKLYVAKQVLLTVAIIGTWVAIMYYGSQ